MDRITVDAKIRFGKPCIRGTRIAVQDILELLAAGETRSAIVKEYELEDADIAAALSFAAKALDSKFIAAE
jgi:uncharacterized protein (DUF433 family)